MVDGPELIWPGKYDADGTRVPTPRPGAVLEAVERIGRHADADRLLHGDNLEALDALQSSHRGGIDLIYIDPPFATGGRFSVQTRVGLGEKRKAAPEISAPAYTDRFEGGATGFLQMLAPRLQLMHDLLAPHGSLYLHVDPTVGHMAKLLLDEVFGPGCFQREIVWRIGWISGFKSKAKNWIRNHDLIFFYVKDPQNFTFNKKYVPYPEGYVRRDGKPPTGRGVPIDDVWNANESEFALRGPDSLDSIQIKSFSGEKCGYATQKNESLARRIIEASSNPGDVVADFFCGSGTVGVAARRLGRRFVGSDCSSAAVHIAKKRLIEVGGEAAPALSVERVTVPTAARREAYKPRVCAHLGIALEPAGPFAGRSDAAAVYVADMDEAVDAALIERLAAQCPDDITALEVVGRRFDLALPWTPPEGVDVTLLRVGEDLWNDAVAAVPGAALCEVPDVEVDVVESDDGFALALRRYRFAHPERLDERLRAAATDPLDLVDAWSVTWRPVPLLALQTDAVHQRTHQRRALPDQTAPHPVPDKPQRAMLKIVDVLYQSTTLVCDYEPRGGRVVLTGVRLR
ncbi:MAG: site-specific DNA-methyltransferase [Myxococcota bacterium]